MRLLSADDSRPDRLPDLLLTRAAPDGIVKVGDLGLARCFVFAGLSGFTQTGTCAGTLHWMAPEQLRDYKYVGPAADVFSLGAVLFRMLTGRSVRSFPAGSTDDIAEVLDGPIPAVEGVKGVLDGSPLSGMMTSEVNHAACANPRLQGASRELPP